MHTNIQLVEKMVSGNILLLDFSFPVICLSPFLTCIVHTYIVYSHNDGVSHTARAPEGREGQNQAGPKGHKLEVGARRAAKLPSSV